jgi:hypothetical protein
MTIKTFDSNRVGGGTFQLEQDATGAYRIKEVGFVKLPDLKLPEIDQAAYTPPTSDDDDTTTDPCPPGFKLVDGVCQRIETSGGGGAGDQLDLTGAGQLENIQKDATTLAGQDTGIVPTRDRTDINQGAIQVEGLREKEAYDKAVANYNAIAERNRDFAMGRQPLSTEDRLQNKADIDAARNEMDAARKNYEGTFEIIKAAPEIADFSKGPRTVPTGTLTGAKTATTPIDQGTFTKESIDKSFLGEEGTTTKKNVLKVAEEKVKKLFDPEKSMTFQIAKGATNILKGMAESFVGPQQVALNNSNKNALDSLGYKTRGELGSSVDPGRIASAVNPDGSVTTSAIENVFIGMNRTSVNGDIMAGARKRVSTVQKTIDRALAKGDTAKAKRFQERKDRYNAQIAAAQKKKQEADLATGGVAPGASGGGGGSGGCFIKGTLITMFDGSKKPVEKVNLGDNVAIGGKVFAVGKFLNTELYDYKGIKVSGSHMVNEDGTWLRVRDTKHGKSLGDNLNTVYVFGSENRRILIDDILFTDYFEVSEQDQLINNEEDFFNNWKSYETIIDKHNVNTLNAN